MKTRKPMKRGIGFKRKPATTRAAAKTEAVCGLPADDGAVEQQPATTISPLRRGTYASTDVRIRISPKPEPHRNRHLLDMARGKPCLVRVLGVCSFDIETTIAAHSNSSAHGKAGARKANDEYSVWCCFHCHTWLDQGRASAGAKDMAFMSAHLAQVCEWRAIAGSTAADPKDRIAAQWALDHLNATPVGLPEAL